MAVLSSNTAAQGVFRGILDAKFMRIASFTLIGTLVLMVAFRLYQQAFAWKAGLDSTAPEFDTYWMTLLKIEIPILLASWVILWAWLWRTRDRNLAALGPREELRRYFNLLAFLGVYAFAVYFTGSFFAEEDGAWHQTVVRDTSFTPSHIVLFYGTIPLYILFGVGSFLYAMTRLPKFAERISIPLLVAVIGPFLILPNLGFNEWGHAFWMMEELFIAPLHWGFVVLGWALLALGGILMQLTRDMLELIDRIQAEAEVA